MHKIRYIDFQNIMLNSQWHCLRQMPQKLENISKQLCSHSFQKINAIVRNASSPRNALNPRTLKFCFFFHRLNSFPNDEFQPFPKRRILDSSKLKRFADNNFKVNETGRKFFKWVETTMGTGGIAHYEQFLLFPQCFQKFCTADT